MENIRIKRATYFGLIDCYGTLYEHAGFQFCFVYSESFYYLIELSSGGYAGCITAGGKTKRQAFNVLKKHISSKTQKNIQDAVSDFMERYKDGFTFPINKPITLTI